LSERRRGRREKGERSSPKMKESTGPYHEYLPLLFSAIIYSN